MSCERVSTLSATYCDFGSSRSASASSGIMRVLVPPPPRDAAGRWSCPAMIGDEVGAGWP